MNKDKHSWEPEVRQRVTDHEFEYEPQGWGEMSQLLEGVVNSVSDAAPGPSSDIGFQGSWRAGSLLVLIACMFSWWYFFQPQASQLNHESSLEQPLVPASVEEQQGESFPTEPQAEDTPVPKRISHFGEWDKGDLNITNKANSFIPSASPTTATADNLLTLPEVIPAIREQIRPVPSLPKNRLRLVDAPAASIDLKIPKPAILAPGKRKRDRKKLYPDVIPNY